MKLRLIGVEAPIFELLLERSVGTDQPVAGCKMTCLISKIDLLIHDFIDHRMPWIDQESRRPHALWLLKDELLVLYTFRCLLYRLLQDRFAEQI